MDASTRTLTLAVIATIAYNVVLTLLAIWQNWPSQFGIVGTDPVKEWPVSGTAISAPVLPLLVLLVALVLLAAVRGRFRIVGDLLVLLTAALFVIGGIGEIAGRAYRGHPPLGSAVGRHPGDPDRHSTDRAFSPRYPTQVSHISRVISRLLRGSVLGVAEGA